MFRRLLRRFALWLLRLVDRLAADPLQDAIEGAFGDCGLDRQKAKDPNFDIARTGKLHEVIEHTTARLQKPHPLRTVADLKKLVG